MLRRSPSRIGISGILATALLVKTLLATEPIPALDIENNITPRKQHKQVEKVIEERILPYLNEQGKLTLEKYIKQGIITFDKPYKLFPEIDLDPINSIGDRLLLAQIESIMKPGKSSEAGFLGPNESLLDVIEGDSKTLENYGITHEQIGDRLDYLMGRAFRLCDLEGRESKDFWEKYYEAIRNGVLIDGKYRVSARGWGGYQECPFANDIMYTCGKANHDFTVKNEETGKTLEFSQLMSHLIRDHHFFEGETSYRVDPEEVIRVLELKTGVDYTPKTETEILWIFGSSTSDTEEDFYGSHEIIDNAERQIDIAKGVMLYIRGDEGVVVSKKKKYEFKKDKPIGDDLLHPRSREVRRGQTLLEKVENRYVVEQPYSH